MFYSTRFLFQPCVTYYKCKFITIEFLKMRHWEILSQEFFGEFYADTFFDCLSNIYINASGDSSSEYISDSGDVNIRPTKRKKILSDWFWYKKWNWNSGCWRRYYRCVTTECNNLRSEVKSLSCVWLCDPMNYSQSGSSVHWILQARILEWAAISFSRGFSQPSNQTQSLAL